jgi:hypothetical protein
MLHVNIMACEGRPPYLETTLQSLPSDSDVTVFYQYETTPLGRSDVRVVNNKKVSTLARENAAWHYAHILRHGTPHGQHLLILEDDVQCCRHFDQRVETIIQQLPTPSITALYACYQWGQPGEPLRLASYPVQDFYGTQAMLFDRTIAPQAADFLEAQMYERAQYDMQLKEVCRQHQVGLYASSYSLVQHIGAETTGMSAYHHQADNFIDDRLPH